MKKLPTRRRVKRRETVTAAVLRSNPGLSERWISYLEEEDRDQRLTIQGWLNIVNDPPEIADLNNLGIRDFRHVGRAEAEAIFQAISTILGNTVSQVSAGDDSFDHHPLTLFVRVLEASDRKRIRRCVVCERYFYANRGNKRLCSERCGTTARVRRHREKGPEYELNRKIARAMEADREEQHKRDIRSQLKKGPK